MMKVEFYGFFADSPRHKFQLLFFSVYYRCGGCPCSIMARLLTRMQEFRGSNPSAAPPKFGAQKHPHTPPPGRKDASRALPPHKKRGHVGWCTPKAEHPGWREKKNIIAKPMFFVPFIFPQTSTTPCSWLAPWTRRCSSAGCATTRPTSRTPS